MIIVGPRMADPRLNEVGVGFRVTPELWWSIARLFVYHPFYSLAFSLMVNGFTIVSSYAYIYSAVKLNLKSSHNAEVKDIRSTCFSLHLINACSLSTARIVERPPHIAVIW